MSLLAGGLAARGHEVWLVTLSAAERDFFAVDARVRRVGLDLQRDSGGVLRGLWANTQRLRALRRVVANIAPDALLSFVTRTNVLAILACTSLRIPVVVSERVDPSAHRETRLWAALRAIVYHRAAAVVVQTEAVARWFRSRLGKHPAVAVIPNPVVVLADSCQLSVEVPQPFLLAAGRLVPQKGFDLLIRAFANVTPRCPQLRLAIAGVGPAATALRDLVAQFRLEGQVFFLGEVRNLQAFMRQAEAFVLSSRYEGFPNVLLEALANGLPVVATDCPGGPREILNNGEFGLLVPCEDETALAAAIHCLATNAELRSRLSGHARAAVAPYTLTRVVEEWEALLERRRAVES
jgi:GalNAc-alpha-(1->4)-GalNAc-alpha-(1->3)-diNAcBac-PP-undecaprenol alpha-1,4-N-acetyl-D-galactosaminyltransferase